MWLIHLLLEKHRLLSSLHTRMFFVLSDQSHSSFMASDARPPSTLASLRPGSEAWKAAVEKLKIPPPTGQAISSTESLAKWLKECDPETKWLQSKEERNVFLQHARDAVMRVLDKNEDGQYKTTWAKAGTAKRAEMINKFNILQPWLSIFTDQWVAELFLSKCIRTKNIKRNGKENGASEHPTLAELLEQGT
jgi:hypothetical protein